MNQKAIDKIHLCLNELQMMKQLIDLKVADDFCSRILGVYVMMRVDDITKMWSHSIPKTDTNYPQAEAVKNQYNQGLRQVRDKLGAHFQTPNGKVDLFASVEVFRFIDYANTVCLIDAIIRVQSLIEGIEVVTKGFCDEDLRTAKETLEVLNSDDQAYLTCGALDTFGINKGGLMSCTEPQVKGQYLKSIELMVDMAAQLYKQTYKEKNAERIFKRLYVCMVYNYHDNLITRTDINNKAVQYEEGFDKLFLQLISKTDNKTMLEGAFDKFEAIYKVEPTIKKYRKVRDHACAHLDEDSDVTDINKELDALDIQIIKNVYDNMLQMFNFICNNVLCLTALRLPARSPLYGAKMETVGEIESFYGEKPDVGIPPQMGCVEIMRAIRRRSSDYGEACDALQKKLMSRDVVEYQEITAYIAQRLKEPSVSDEEQTTLQMALKHAKGGSPQRLQRTLMAMINDPDIFKLHSGHLLWLLSAICIEDEDIDIPKTLDSVIVQNQPIPTALALLALLHLTLEKGRSRIVANKKSHKVSDIIKSYCDAVTHPTEKCMLMLVLIQHWFWDTEYAYDRSYECEYTKYFEDEMKKSLEQYFGYIKMTDKKERDLCELYLQRKWHVLLLYRLAEMEKVRNQKPNLFAEAWRYNCFIRTKCNLYEAFGVGFMDEFLGLKAYAKIIFETLVKENPINDDAIQTLADFYKRNPGLKK